MNSTDAWAAAQAAGDPSVIEQLGGNILDKVLKQAHARIVYGDPIERVGCTIIPVAKVSARFGFGGGGGRANTDEGPEGGSGGGGGGTINAKPIGYIEVTDAGAEFHAIEDSTQIALAALRIGLVFTVLLGVKLLFWKRSSKRKAVAAAVVAPSAAKRRRMPFRRTANAEVQPEPVVVVETRAGRRWRRSA